MPEARVAVIPARGGSKRLPGKNVRPFFGHPMLAYSIAAARASGVFERIIVSTDDPDIGRIAAHYGAEYLPRPAELASNTADLAVVSLHVLDALSAKGFHATELCQLMPNCPLRRAQDVRDQLDLFEGERRAFQISVVPYRAVYPHWAVVQDGNGGRFLFDEKLLNVRSQDLQRTWCPTGAIWWTRCKEFRCQRAFYGDPYWLAPMDANRGIDIDSAEDVELAELLVRGMTSRDGVSPLEPIPEAAYREAHG